jgi:hypothetical protein
MGLYLRSPILIHGVVFSYLSTGTILPFTFTIILHMNFWPLVTTSGLSIVALTASSLFNKENFRMIKTCILNEQSVIFKE